MIEIVSRVQELAALADSALPRAAEIPALDDSIETALLVALSSLRVQVEQALSLIAADIDRKSARELGASGMARRAGMKTGVELVQKLTGATRADAARAVRAGEMFETAEAVSPADPGASDVGDGAATDSTSAPAARNRLDPGPRSIDTLAALTGAWDAPIAVATRNHWLSIDQGDALRRGLGSPPTPPGAALDPDHDAHWRRAALQLIDACWEGGLTPEDAKRHATQLRAALDREWASTNAHRLHQQRSLKRVIRSDGMVRYDLLLDPLTDAEIWTPIFRHLAPRLGGPRFTTHEEQQQAALLEADTRTNEQLLADTFTGFLLTGITSTRNFGTYAPTVNIAVTAGDLREALHAEKVTRAHNDGDHTGCPGQRTRERHPACAEPPARREHDRDRDRDNHQDQDQDQDRARARIGSEPPGECDGPPTSAALGWLEGKPEPIMSSQILSAICSGVRLATLFDDTGRALDVTKHERTFSARQRTAMALRDGGCLMPSCTMPPGACEGHHINPWNEDPQNRRTETRDGVLLCRFHHLNLHNQGGRVERRGNDYWLRWPGQEPLKLIPKHGVTAQLRHEHDAT